MKFVFLRAYDFPVGGAPQQRLLAICKGLSSLGHEVAVYQYTPSKKNIEINNKKFKNYQGINIYNNAWMFSPIGGPIRKGLGCIVGLFLTIKQVVAESKKNKIDFIAVNSESLIYMPIFYILSRFTKSKLWRDLNEYPRHLIFHDKKKFHSVALFECIRHKWFDDIIVISNALEVYYRPLLNRHARILLVPILVELERFSFDVNAANSSRYITYCGDLSNEKDGVDILLESFSKIADEYPELLLRLIGFASNTRIKQIMQMTDELGIRDKIEITGFVSPDILPDVLKDSMMLALARPDNMQAKGGMPTKLGEYLATGCPTIVTRVGDIPLYLQDGFNAYMAEPDSPKSFAEAIKRCIQDENSKLVGARGREVAELSFNNIVWSKRLVSFLGS